METIKKDRLREAEIEINNKGPGETESHVSNQNPSLNGNSEAEAADLQTETRAKRTRADEMSTQPETSKKLKTDASQSSTILNTTPKINWKKPVRLGFTAADRTRPLTAEQMTKLKEAILKTTLTCVTEGVRPQFEACGEQSDWCLLTCSNYSAAEWVRHNIDHIKDYCSLDIELLEEHQFPLSFLIKGNFPNSLEYQNEMILGYISAQNDVCTRQWKVVNRTAIHEILQLEIMIDNASLLALRKISFKIWYCFGILKLSQIGNGSIGEKPKKKQKPSQFFRRRKKKNKKVSPNPNPSSGSNKEHPNDVKIKTEPL
ncbi:uncharacterized protein LOC117782515 [Drosophila innubila]|uniref:uncharacterized protein LOC117782515 n=1 Tax=Drosophila innubila TaxID=198719 RepID=UPI00148BE748|nr:uncharacterized protein LOC117782515 [Drosophila innubila]